MSTGRPEVDELAQIVRGIVDSPRLVRCPLTGAMIFAGREDQHPLETEAVRKLLTNFP